ncbi:MAG: hypothetical protein WD960_01625 [Gemmatimonadota bacterium]
MATDCWSGVLVLPFALVVFGNVQAQEAERRWLGEVSLGQSIGGDAGPVVFGMPALLTAGPNGGFTIADFGDGTVRTFDREGRERWSFGRRGAGPGEFGGFGSLQFQSDGALAVLDPELQRVTLVGRDGALVSTTRIPDPARRLLPSRGPDGDWILVPRDRDHLWVTVDRKGRRTGQRALPAELRVRHPLINEAFTARSDSGSVIAYRWSSRLVFLDGSGSVRGIISGIEEVPFPTLSRDVPGVTRVDPDATRAALDVSASRGRIFVLFAGEELANSRTVDVYDEASMSYLGSYRIPDTVSGIAALADGRLATLEKDLVPVVRIWSLDDSE